MSPLNPLALFAIHYSLFAIHYQLFISFPLFSTLNWLLYFSLKQCYLEERRKRPDTGWLAVFFAASFVLYLCHFLYFSGVENNATQMLYFVCNLSVYPLFRFWMLRLTGRPIGAEAWLLLPALLLPTARMLCIRLGLTAVAEAIYTAERLAFAALVVYVVVRGLLLLRRYRIELDDCFTDDRSSQFRPLNILLWLFAATAVLSMLLNIFGREWFKGKTIVIGPALLMSMLLWWLGFTTSRLPESPEQTERKILRKSTARQTTATPLLPALERLMFEERPYLNPQLTVIDVAQMLGTNRTYISQLMRDELHTTFADYINHQRVQYAKRLLQSADAASDHEAVQNAIALAGFPSESTFYRIFKQQTGLSPLQYRRRKQA